MIVDFHTHYIPEKWPDSTNKSNQHWPKAEVDVTGEVFLTIKGKKVQKLEESVVKPESRFQYMDQSGINIQVLSPPPYLYCYDTPKEDGSGICKWLNNAVAEVVKKWPDRFQGLGVVPLQDVSLAIEEAERARDVLNLKGIAIGTSVNGKNLDDAEFEMFWAKIDSLGLPLFLNPYGGIGSERLKKHNFNNLIGNGLELCTAAGSLIFGGVLDRHPEIKFCFALGGGSLISQIHRMNHGYSVGGESHLKQEPVRYLKSLYFDTLTHSSLVLKNLIEEAGTSNIVFGSDYPFEMGDPDLKVKIETVVSGKEDQNKIFYSNAARILRLKTEEKS